MTDGIEITLHVHCIECYNYIAVHSHIGFAKGTSCYANCSQLQIQEFLTGGGGGGGCSRGTAMYAKLFQREGGGGGGGGGRGQSA